MKNVIIIGATSAIAEAVAQLYALESANLYLIARDTEKLTAIQQDLTMKGANIVDIAPFDAHKINSHKVLIDRAFNALGHIDVLLIAHGSLQIKKLTQ